MRATSVKVLDVIVHVLPRGVAQPRLSEVAIPKTSDPRIFDYFATHVTRSLNSPQAHTAKFENLGTGRAQVCGDILSGTVSLVEGSKSLAKELHQIVQQDQRISTGDLAVCLVEAVLEDDEKDDAGRKVRQLALMKMDPGTGFRQVRKRDRNGQDYVSFEIEEQIMPREGEPLQKCAFIQTLDPGAEYHMLLIDRQIHTTTGLEIATFFKVDFLQAKPALDPPKATAKLYDALKAIEADLEGHLSADKHKEIADAHQGALDLPSIDLDRHKEELDAIMIAADVPAPLRAKAKRRLSTAAFPDQVVKIDPRTVAEKRKREKTVWEGDEKLRLIVPAAFPKSQLHGFDVEGYKAPIKKRDPNKFGGKEYYEITIETRTWEKVS